jgi:hypothetical protein
MKTKRDKINIVAGLVAGILKVQPMPVTIGETTTGSAQIRTVLEGQPINITITAARS